MDDVRNVIRKMGEQLIDEKLELKERIACLELSCCHAINAIDKGDIADARIILEDAVSDMFKED